MQRTVSGAITVILLAMPGAAAASRCVLPVPDGGDMEPSPASLIGELVGVASGEVLVRKKGNAKPLRILVHPSTDLFTVYGGGLDAPQLRSGQHVLIWFKDCAAPKRGTPVAAVLEVCSLAPEPCPK